MIGVYKIVINNKTYVGSSFNIKTRIRQHKSDLKRGRHDNPYLQKAFVKYQEFNWEVVEEVVCNITDKELRKLEKQWMEKLHPEYNMQDPETNFIIKKVYQFSKNGEFIKEYESTAEAALELGISQSNVRPRSVLSQTRVINCYTLLTFLLVKEFEVRLYLWGWRDRDSVSGCVPEERYLWWGKQF